MRHLCSIDDWKVARELFKAKHPMLSDMSKYDHFWTYYLPEVPRWGNAAHRPGEVHSVQGLEKSWDIDKQFVKHEKKLYSGEGIDLRNILAGISNR